MELHDPGTGAFDVERRQFGMGAKPSEAKSGDKRDAGYVGTGADGRPDIEPNTPLAMMYDALLQNISDTPVVLQSRSHFTGPLTDGATGGIKKLLAPECDLFQFGKSVPDANNTQLLGVNSVGAPQTAFLILGVFCHFIPPEFNFTQDGIAYTAPSAGAAMPVAPDSFFNNDIGATSALGGAGAVKAFLNQGDWQQRMFYSIARAYNWVWTVGTNRTVLNWPLRNIAKCIPAPQSFTSAQALIDTTEYIGLANAYYRAPPSSQTATTKIFVGRNARWSGVSNVAATQASNFQPDLLGTRVAPTYGGLGVQELGCNAEYFRLPYAVVFPRATSLGMKLAVVDGQALNNAQIAGSITNSTSGVTAPTPPALLMQDANFSTTGFIGSGSSPVFPVLSQDSPPAQQFLKIPSGMTMFKIGDWYWAIGCVGYELNEDQYDSLKAVHGDLRAKLEQLGLPVRFPGLGD